MTKHYIPAPNWTGVPNPLLDNLGDFTESELKCLLAAIREIIGWHKNKPQPMSVSWFVKKTGLSKSAAEDGIKASVDRGWLVFCGTGKRGVNLYDINILPDDSDLPDKEDSEGTPPDDLPDKEDSTSPIKKIVPPRSSGRLKDTPSKKSKSKKKDSADAAAAAPRERDLMFDAVAEHIFKITTPEELAAAQAADQSASRAGIIAAWLKGTSDGYTPPNAKRRVEVGFISAPAKPEHVALFSSEWAVNPKNKNSNLPLDLRKFVDQWRAWASTKRQKQSVPAAEHKLSPEQEAERDAAFLKDLEEINNTYGR